MEDSPLSMRALALIVPVVPALQRAYKILHHRAHNPNMGIWREDTDAIFNSTAHDAPCRRRDRGNSFINLQGRSLRVPAECFVGGANCNIS